MMNKDEAVKKLATVGHLSMAHAEDLYDSFFEKPVVPQYVADWYEGHKDEFYLNLHRVVRDFFEHLSAGYFNENPINYDFACWYYNTKNAIQTLVTMHQFGYEGKEEMKYTVTMKNVSYNGHPQFLCTGTRETFWSCGGGFRKTKYTRKELEEAGFGWVFDCEGIEIEEVE